MSAAVRATRIRPSRSIPVILSILVLADVVSSFESAMVLLALPRLSEYFAVSLADASWTITAFMLVAAASAATCGRLGDIYGRRRVLIWLLAVSVVGSVVSIATDTLAGVIVGRAIQGISGGILPLCFGLAREHLPARRVPVAVALIAGAAGLAAAGGTLVTGVLIDLADWHLLFVVAAVLAVVSAGFCLKLPESTLVSRIDRIDWVGAVLFVPAIALVLLGVSKSAVWTWADGRTWGTIAGGLLLAVVWFLWELRQTSPMINVRLFLERKLGLSILSTIVLAAGPIGTAGVLIPVMMQSPTTAPIGMGLTGTQTGLASCLVSVIGFAFMPLSGRISARHGSRVALMIGAALGVLGVLGFLLLHATLVGILVAGTVYNIATSFLLSALPNLVVEGAPPENTSEMTGVYTVARTAFMGVGTVLITLILSSSVVPGTRFATLGAYTTAFAYIAAMCVVGLLLALLVPRTRRTPEPAPAAADEVGTPAGP
jgi:MFS family permease